MRNQPKPLRAIIYVPTTERERWERICLAYCGRMGFDVVSLIIGAPDRWDDVMSMIGSAQADVVVVALEEHLRPNRTPRIDVVVEEPPPTPRQRRPRSIRRDEEAR